ncbi:hypothetical protein MLD38_003278 [Melastoma candidum]|uniref:Uncharacterized protein n=1 Tax=Melastoma candidum TaxID=119954 RepID=A0ACB9S227_9MYRT|nr:hypothetical protein MLD38_003278 [Melastoma candidum]
MLLSNRPRHPMRRTTSVSNIVPIPMASTEAEPTGDSAMNPVLDFKQDVGGHGCSELANLGMVVTTNLYGVGASSGGGLSAGWYQRDAVAATAHFLQTCGLCKRRLFPGRDIYMLRYGFF